MRNPNPLLDPVEDPIYPKQLVLPGVEIYYRGWPPPAVALPLVRWVGGKRWAVPIFGPGLWLYLCNTGAVYCEPFCGGAAVAAWLGWPRMILGDTCKPLMKLYEGALLFPEEVWRSFDAIKRRGYDETTYYAIRRWQPDLRADFAARALYLTAVCFNGLWRENAKGEFNVPIGRPASAPSWDEAHPPSFATRERFDAWRRALAGARIRCGDFAPAIDDLQPPAAVYVDPPYASGTTGGFTGYVQGGFSMEDQARLVDCLRRAHDRGIVIVASDGGSEENRSLYEDFLSIFPVAARHSVGATGDRRGRRREWLATNRPEILSSEGVQ